VEQRVGRVRLVPKVNLKVLKDGSHVQSWAFDGHAGFGGNVSCELFNHINHTYRTVLRVRVNKSLLPE